jgi:hypothetical protein
MSFLAVTKQILRRPIISSIVAVGIAILSWYFLADPLHSKPILSRKMHIESIPMCKNGNHQDRKITADALKGRGPAIIMPTS